MPVLGGCLCFDLPTGSKIIGGIYLCCALLNSLGLAFMNLVLWAFDMVPQFLKLVEDLLASAEEGNFHSGEHGSGEDDYEDHSMHMQMDNDTREAAKELRQALDMIRQHIFLVQVMFLMLLVLSVLSVITSSMLIHGIRKNRRGLLVPWVLQELVHIVVAVALIVITFVLFGSSSISWSACLSVLFTVLFQVFFILVVISQFQALGLIRMHDEMCMK